LPPYFGSVNNQSRDEGDSNRNFLAIVHIILPKEGDEVPFFICGHWSVISQDEFNRLLTKNPAAEEPPQDHSICHETQPIPQQDLRSQTPPEEAKI
jgi:hypothetical protein